MKTMADHARAYRVRRNGKMARYEAALTRISNPQGWEDAFVMANFAESALNPDAKDV